VSAYSIEQARRDVLAALLRAVGKDMEAEIEAGERLIREGKGAGPVPQVGLGELPAEGVPLAVQATREVLAELRRRAVPPAPVADHVEEYLQALMQLRDAKARGLAAWNALSKDELVRALEGERDQHLALAAESEKKGDRFMADWHRKDAASVQERIDKAKGAECPACGQRLDGKGHHA
jgi:hypothetical protein